MSPPPFLSFSEHISNILSAKYFVESLPHILKYLLYLCYPLFLSLIHSPCCYRGKLPIPTHHYKTLYLFPSCLGGGGDKRLQVSWICHSVHIKTTLPHLIQIYHIVVPIVYCGDFPSFFALSY